MKTRAKPCRRSQRCNITVAQCARSQQQEKVERHGEQDKNFLPGHMRGIDELNIQRKQRRSQQRQRMSSEQTARRSVKNDQHRGCGKQGKQPKSRDLIAAQTHGQCLQRMKKNLQCMGIALLQIKKSFGRTKIPCLHDLPR